MSVSYANTIRVGEYYLLGFCWGEGGWGEEGWDGDGNCGQNFIDTCAALPPPPKKERGGAKLCQNTDLEPPLPL